MLRRVASALACLLLICTPALAGPEDEALAAYQQFFETFTTDNHDQIVRLFAPDALFYGTRSTALVTTREGIRQYFVTALSSTRGAVKATRLEQTALALSESVVLISGKWQSARTLDGKLTITGPHRNTVVMQKRDDVWLIVQFHNSPVPKPVP